LDRFREKFNGFHCGDCFIYHNNWDSCCVDFDAIGENNSNVGGEKMSEMKLVIENPQDSVGGNKCRLKTNRYANSSVVIEVADFEIDTTNLETMQKGLETFKQFQTHIVELETVLNQPKEKKV